MNTCKIRLLKCIKKSKSELAGTMFSLLPKPLFRDLHEKLHQAIGKLDWQVDICLFVCLFVLLKSAPFCYSRIWKKFLQTNFAFRGEGIAFSEKTLQVISEMFLIMIITESFEADVDREYCKITDKTGKANSC